jgi:tetratricopeptide (TPR) repeat protein
MKKSLLFITILLLSAFAANAQKISKPTLTPAPDTDERKAEIREGIELHDAKRYDDAVTKYKSVLAENPDSILAIYELALTYYTKGDQKNAMETAVRGSKYISDELPLFYGIIASVLDDLKKPDEALKIYKDALKILDDDPKFTKHIADVHFNMGITYFRMRKALEARNELKKSVEMDYSRVSSHYVLSEIFYASQYKVPALTAALRFATLEFNTARSQRAAATILVILGPAQKNEKGNIVINMNLDAPKDEGDFGMYDLLLGTLGALDDKDKKDEKPKTEAEQFIDSLSSTIGFLSEDKGLKKTFIGKQYIPFLAALKTAGHLETLAYVVRWQSGVGDKETTDWIEAHKEEIIKMNDWSKKYQP